MTHRPALLNEVVEVLLKDGKRGGIYIDGTVGSGGHAEAILERIGPEGFLLGIDRDKEAIERTGARLAKWKGQVRLALGNYREMREIAETHGVGRADGVLLDLGVSSEQLDSAGRGFSFNAEAALDMRMGGSGEKTAEKLVNGLSEEELAALFREFGEEPAARRIARIIARERERGPITTTLQLARLAERAYGNGRRGRIHPATRVFQALRIAVNDELGALRDGLAGGLGLLAEGGRMAVISYHSLEDRIVKEFCRGHAGRWESLQSGGRTWVCETPEARILTKKPVTPSEKEIAENPRSRSAKLRAIERLAESDQSDRSDRSDRFKKV